MAKLALHGGSPTRTTPFPTWPIFDEIEERAVMDVLRSGNWWRYSFGQGVNLTETDTGPRSQAAMFQEAFARMHDCTYGIAAANGTATLEMGIRALRFDVGDEVIVPAYTYIASATCLLQNNLVPIFVDIDPETYNIDPLRIEEAITDHTRAIVVVHFAGQPADMDAVSAIARKHNLAIIEDAAHAHGCEWRGKKCGSFGQFGSFSFQASKNMTAGEGGIITTNDRELAARCEALMWAGRRVGRPWYEFSELGWNYRITEFQAAILRGQLSRLVDQNDTREKNATHLSLLLSDIKGIRPLHRDKRTTRHGYHIYLLRYDESIINLPRETFLSALTAEGVPCQAGYCYPVYKNPMFLNKQFINGSFPLGTMYHEDIDYEAFSERCSVAERTCRSEAVWLPQNLFLGNDSDMTDIAEAIRKVLFHKKELT